MSSRSTPLKAFIEAYARAKGVILPAGYDLKNDLIFRAIARTKKGDPVVLPRDSMAYGGDNLEIVIYNTKFQIEDNSQLVEIFNAQKNPRVVGSVHSQIDGKVVRYFDATNTEIDTIYSSKSEKDYNELCTSFGGDNECTAILAQCANNSFGDQCKTLIGASKTLKFTTTSDTKTLLQAFAFLQKLAWKHDKKTYVLETAEEWLARQPAQLKLTLTSTTTNFLNAIVTALNASDVPKQLLTKSNGSSPVDNLDEIKAALAEGRFSVERFLTPYGLFGYPFMRGGDANVNASKKLKAQYDKLVDILKSENTILDPNTKTAIDNEMSSLQKAETDIDTAIKNITKDLDNTAKVIVATREDLKDSNGKQITLATIGEFEKAYEKLHLTVGKISNAFTNAYILLGKFARKASDVTAEKIAAAAPSRKVMAFI